MSAEQVVRDFLNAAEQDAVKASAFLADDFTFSGAVPIPLNKAQWIDLQTAMLHAIPDWKFNITAVQVSSDHVSLRAPVTGTHSGVILPVMPGMSAISPTGKRISLPADRLMFTLRGDKIADLNVESSPDGGLPGILQQIGVSMPG